MPLVGQCTLVQDNDGHPLEERCKTRPLGDRARRKLLPLDVEPGASVRSHGGVPAIPEDAIARAILRWRRIVESKRLIVNVLPVPPGASKKNIPGAPKQTLSRIASCAVLWPSEKADAD
eukprot:758302-Hanusia_phi.AAC.2